MKGNSLMLKLLAVLCGLGAAVAEAGDWPTWRYDAARSAASPEALADELHPEWVRAFRPVGPAWPNEPRLWFDASYEPVAADGRLFLGSPHDGSVRCLELASGVERWRFYTEGPVRFAPAACEGRVYAGSDDGYLYCLDAATGNLLWKVRGAPSDLPDRRHLGNARFISFWPVRGGPVLDKGTVYFAAGIWPTMGVFVVAVDAETGEFVWRADELDRIDEVRLDHNDLRESGLSPQGYLAVEGDRLLVPNGRSMPAALDRATGKLLWYVQGYRNGDCRVIATDRYALVGDAGVVDLETGREVGSRWAAAGDDAPDAFDGSRLHLFEGPYLPYKFLPGCSARSVLAGNLAYGQKQGRFYAYDLSRATTSEYDKEAFNRVLKPWRWDAPLEWEIAHDPPNQGPTDTPLVLAGNRLYGYTAGKLVAVELPAGEGDEPKIAWSKPFDETPSSLLAAGDRLLVVTKEGRIHCFGREQTAVNEIGPEADDSAVARQGPSTAAEILQRTGVAEGYCVVLGGCSRDLLLDLVEQSELKLIGVDPDAAKIHRLRRVLDEKGLYGNRVELFVGEPAAIRFPPYLASLVVAETADVMPVARLRDLLRPYGGTACLALSDEAHEKLAGQASAMEGEGTALERAGRYTLLRRVGALVGSAAWTHECGDAARSYHSRDELVKPSLEILWYGDGEGHGFWKRKDYGVGVKPQVVGGRLFALRLSTNTLVAYDVYTGRHLWQVKVEPFTRYASMEDGVYLAAGGMVRVLDPATGQERRAFGFAAEGEPAVVADVRVADDVVVIAAAAEKVRAIEKGLWDAQLLVSLDRASGEVLWKRRAELRFNSNAFALGGGMVFVVDSLSAIESDTERRRADPEATEPSTILALDARTGRVQWTAVKDNPYRTYTTGHWLTLRGNDDWLAYSESLGLLVAGKQKRACAFEAASGHELWQKPIGAAPWVLRGETFLHQGGGVVDLRTGEHQGTAFSIRRGGCNYFVAGPHLLFIRERSVSYFDFETKQRRSLFAIRSGCSNSLVAADGLLSVPNFAVGCVCNYPIQTSFAMVHVAEEAR